MISQTAPEAELAATVAALVRSALVGSDARGARRALAALAALSPENALALAGERSDTLVASLGAAPFAAAVGDALRNLADGDASRAVVVGILERVGECLSGDDASAALARLGPPFDAEMRALLERLLVRRPASAGLLRLAVEDARCEGEAERLDGLANRLALADPSVATVSHVYRLRKEFPSEAGLPIRIALASSFTVDHLVPYADLSCRLAGLRPHLYVSPFNSWARDVIDEHSALRAFEPEILFLAVALDDLVPALAGSLPSEALERLGDEALERVVAVAQRYCSWSQGRPLVVHAFHSAFAAPEGILDGRFTPSRAEWIASLNARLATALRALPNALLLDLTAAASVAGGSLEDEPKLRHLAGMRLPPRALAGIGRAYARYAAPARGLVRKCVVLDLDNTLWGGVLGEDGQDGIRLGEGAPGSEFVEFQRYLHSLAERGILLAINSKNNADEALAAIRSHPAMILREADFSAMRINWQPKPDNMLELARELNIGVDSLVFIDDNPEERERMRRLRPEVLTVELPRDPALYRATLEALPQLQALAITNEDRGRVDTYRTARLREQSKQSAGSVDEYLRSLEIRIEIARAERGAFARVAQLFARTNQFNVTTRRYELADIERFAADPALRLWVLRSQDRFGEHGLVAVTLVRCVAQVWTLDSFLMSCRVIGYGIETALLAFVAERARAAGAARLEGEFVPTAKNAPARELFATHGFRRDERASDGDVANVERQRWTLALAGAGEPLVPPWIALQANGA
ncbi:MAG: HAD-IIIC family phosphatase [Vulcanimicrobiaceae bacterium]